MFIIMGNLFVLGMVSWFLPGYGHLKQGRWKRGVLIAFVIWTMFIIGIASGGAFYRGEGGLFYLLDTLSKLGNGLGFLICFFLSSNPPADAASWVTFEYGARFLEVAGLLNYLAIIDSTNINFSREKE